MRRSCPSARARARAGPHMHGHVPPVLGWWVALGTGGVPQPGDGEPQLARARGIHGGQGVANPAGRHLGWRRPHRNRFPGHRIFGAVDHGRRDLRLLGSGCDLGFVGEDEDPDPQQPYPDQQPQRRGQHPDVGAVDLGLLGISITVADRDLAADFGPVPEAHPRDEVTVRPSAVVNSTTGWWVMDMLFCPCAVPFLVSTTVPRVWAPCLSS